MKLRKIKWNVVKISFGIAAVGAVIGGCKKDADAPEPPEQTAGVFDKQALLQNMADQIIVPNLNLFKTSLDSVELAFKAFKKSGAREDFLNVRKKFDVSYRRYQHVSLFAFGPGEEQGIRVNFNIFPCSRTEIQANINLGSYDLNTATNIDTKGLPALDYLFYGYANNEDEIYNAFVKDAQLSKYVEDVLAEMIQRTNNVLGAWNGGYRNWFVSNLATDVGSPLGFLLNQLNFELDYLKNSKIATPLGLRSGGKPLPDNCEAYHGGQSLTYALETLSAIEDIYLGRNLQDLNGAGFDDYLKHLGIKHLDSSLDDDIQAQFAVARTKLNLIKNPLSAQVLSNSETVNTAYKELVKLLVLLKTDMPSGLGVVITYQDGDGD